MRLWTMHPRFLDTKGLQAVWREGLLAQTVLQNQTAGDRNHPLLKRFRAAQDPVSAIGTYLQEIHREATRRGYQFSQDKIAQAGIDSQIPCTRGQLLYEWKHLLNKLRQRDADRYKEIEELREPQPHPLFHIIDGDIEDWEIRDESS